jgi:hypothetical protein
MTEHQEKETIVMRVRGAEVKLRPDKEDSCGICRRPLKNKAYKMLEAELSGIVGSMYGFHKASKTTGAEENFIKIKWNYVCLECARSLRKAVADLMVEKAKPEIQSKKK